MLPVMLVGRYRRLRPLRIVGEACAEAGADEATPITPASVMLASSAMMAALTAAKRLR